MAAPAAVRSEELIEVSLLSLNLRRSALAAAAALLLVLPAGAPPVAARPAPDSFADLADKLLPSVVNISTTQTLKTDKQKEHTPGRPQFPPGSPFEEFFQGSREPAKRPPRGEAAQGNLAWLRLCCGCGGHHRHQQSRYCRCRRDHRQARGQPRAEGRGGRPRHQNRCRGAQGQDDKAAGRRALGRSEERR